MAKVRSLMSINKYSTFLKVVEAGSITLAAASLGHTQSGVTQLIHSLEKELGVSLLKRSRSGICLTEDGKALLPYIEKVVQANVQLEKAALLLKVPHDRAIRIGAFKSVAVNWLPEIIKEYQKISPATKFDLVDCGYNNIEETLSKQQIDFAFVPLPIYTDCKCIPVYKDPLLAVVPKDHRIAGQTECPVSEFAKEPVIRLIPSIDMDAGSVYEKNQLIPHTKYTVEDDYAMLAMVEQGLGICIMPQLILQGIQKEYTALPLRPRAYRTIGIAFPSYETTGQEAINFADFAADWIKSHQNKT